MTTLLFLSCCVQSVSYPGELMTLHMLNIAVYDPE